MEAQHLQHVARGDSFVGIGAKREPERFTDGPGQLRTELLDGRDARLGHRLQNLELGQRLTREGVPAGEQLPEKKRRAVDVRTHGDRVAVDQLGGHVAVRAEQRSGRRHVGDAGDASDAEVGELHLAVSGDEHVAGCHVAMDDRRELAGLRVARAVRGGEGCEDARADVEDLRVFEALAAIALGLNERLERDARDVLEHERRRAFEVDEVVKSYDGRV